MANDDVIGLDCVRRHEHRFAAVASQRDRGRQDGFRRVGKLVEFG